MMVVVSHEGTTMPTPVIRSLGAFVPLDRLTNADLEGRLDTTDAWIRTRTGIRERRVAARGVSTSDLAVEAGRRALSGFDGNSIDMLILATATPDHPVPATAPDVAERLGLGRIPAFDVGAVCSGFIYALSLAAGNIRGRMSSHVLVIGAENFTSLIDPRDRNTAVLFGDGAGAMVISASDESESVPGAILRSRLGSDGGLKDAILVATGGSRNRPENPAQEPRRSFLSMDGTAVFSAAVTEMTRSAAAVMNEAGWEAAEIDWLVAHQANERILRQVSQLLQIDSSRAVVHLDKVGNTSAASIPLALAASARRFCEGDKIILTAFGGGATWGALALTWPSIDVLDPHYSDASEIANV